MPAGRLSKPIRCRKRNSRRTNEKIAAFAIGCGSAADEFGEHFVAADMNYWETIADNLSKAGWGCGCISNPDRRMFHCSCRWKAHCIPGTTRCFAECPNQNRPCERVDEN